MEIAFWIGVERKASCVIAEIEFSLARCELLCSSASSGSMPPASTIEFRFSAESPARLASAAAACSCY